MCCCSDRGTDVNSRSFPTRELASASALHQTVGDLSRPGAVRSQAIVRKRIGREMGVSREIVHRSVEPKRHGQVAT